MPSTISPTAFTDAAFNEFLAARDEPGWLVDQRRTAWKKFNELPMPTRQDEEWMRTDIRTFRFSNFGLPQPASAGLDVPPGLLTHGVQLAGRSVTLNSQQQAAELATKWRDRGVLFGSLDVMVREHGD